MRRIPALVSSAAAATFVAVALTGCTTTSYNCTPALSAGDASKLVTATGAVGEKPTASTLPGFAVDGSQRSVLVEGSGAPARAGDVLDIDLSLIDGVTGEVVNSTSYGDDAAGSPGVNLYAAGGEGALNAALVCARPGDRIVVASSFGDSGLAGPNASDEARTNPIALVVDVHQVFLGKADGMNQLPQDGMPTVVTAVDGTPGLQLPKEDAPTETRVATIKAGGGAALKDGDTAVVHFSRWTWPAGGGELGAPSSSWGSSPTALQVVRVSDANPSGLPEGLYTAVHGATVGSQVLAVIPADPATGETAPSIFVLDILGVAETSGE